MLGLRQYDLDLVVVVLDAGHPPHDSARGHDLKLIDRIDAKRRPSEITDDIGIAAFRTSETCDLDWHDPVVAAVDLVVELPATPENDAGYVRRVTAYYDSIADRLRERGVEYVPLSTAQPVEEALVAWANRRRGA